MLRYAFVTLQQLLTEFKVTHYTTSSHGGWLTSHDWGGPSPLPPRFYALRFDNGTEWDQDNGIRTVGQKTYQAPVEFADRGARD